MVVNINGKVQRHLGFATVENLLEQLHANPPLHLYHSVALYRDPTRNPGAPQPTPEGADVLIDIDCKPGPPPRGDGYPDLDAALAAAKGYMLRTLRILHDELGIRERHYELAFSGFKGYHCVLVHPELQALDSQARRELATYLTGDATHLHTIFPGRNGLAWPTKAPQGGLRRRIYQGLQRLHALSHPATRPPNLEALVDRHNPTSTPTGVLLNQFAAATDVGIFLREDRQCSSILYAAARELTCPRIDVPVIGNLRGMNRTPGSLHGKTGLRCTPIPTQQELERFDPFRDAAAFPLDEEVGVRGLQKRAVTAAATRYEVHPGEGTRLPTSIALAFLLSGAAYPLKEGMHHA